MHGWMDGWMYVCVYLCYLNLKGVLQIHFWDWMHMMTAFSQDLQAILQSESEVQHPGCSSAMMRSDQDWHVPNSNDDLWEELSLSAPCTRLPAHRIVMALRSLCLQTRCVLKLLLRLALPRTAFLENLYLWKVGIILQTFKSCNVGITIITHYPSHHR